MALRGQGYKPIPTEDESGSEGADGTLSLYSRLIYFVTKKQLIAKKELPNETELDELDVIQKASYKEAKRYYKGIAKKAVKESAGISHAIQVFNGKSKFKSGPDASAEVEGLAMGSSATFMDFIITFFRSAWQVLSNVIVNFRVDQADPQKAGEIIGNDDRDNPGSHYNQTMYNHNGDPSSGLSPVGIAGVAFALVSPVLGLLRGFYQIFRKNKLKSLAYAREQNKEVNPDNNDQDDAALYQKLKELLKKAMKENTLSVYPTLRKQPLASDRKTFLDKMIDAVVAFYNTGAKSEFKPVRYAANVFRTLVTSVSVLWDRLSTYAYIFWLAWMPFVMVCGLAAASGPMLPFVLLITLTLGTALTVLKLVRENTPKSDVPDTVKGEFDRLAHEVKVLKFIDEENLGISKKLEIAKAKPRFYPNASAQSELRERLLGSIHERRARVAITGLRSFVGGLLVIVFVAWFGSALIGYLGATAAAGFIGDTPFGGIGGAIAGLITGVISMAQMRQAQLAYEQQVDTVLQGSYRDTAETKEQAFQRLYAQVEHRKSLLRDSRVGGDKDIAEYLNNIDPFNPDLSKFRHEASIFSWTGVKKGLNRAFEFIFGGQTGAFTARFFLLKGGLLVGALGFVSAGAAFVPFLIAAAVLIAIVGVLAVVDYQMKANHGHREDMLNTLDARIYYLEKKNEELCALQIKHDVDAQNAGTLVPVEEEQVQPASSPSPSPLGYSGDFNMPNQPSQLTSSGESLLVMVDQQVAVAPEPLQQAAISYNGYQDAFFAPGSKPRMQPTATRSPDAFFASGEKLAHARVILPERFEVSSKQAQSAP